VGESQKEAWAFLDTRSVQGVIRHPMARKKRKLGSRRKKIGMTYRGFELERRGKGRKDVDIFSYSINGEKLYQASALDTNEAKRIIDAMRGD
jgi:hypothetical protein